LDNSPQKACFLYVLKSTVKDWYYIGVTNDIGDRLNRHNNGRSISTKAYKPFELMLSKAFNSKAEAMEEEARLKSFKNRDTLLKYIKDQA